ncbi:TAP-like protein [Microbacterium sp. cf046]|uniref:alpha/beta fold hydrolase n=1 Tax=Microbacterium sp. cf046 TaxID=1761803 RepID=UPI0008F371A1|nr:alpha/beta fold hydrolase [Microbacterium sp. cf046]SFS14752.1 TAP-like protein [Microbacterium sp. cf046]
MRTNHTTRMYSDHSIRRPVRGLAASVSLLVLLLAGCTASSDDSSDDTAPAPDGTTASNFEYVDCPSPNIEGVAALEFPPEVRCGYLTVPENRGDPEGKQIRIFVIRSPATSDDPEPDPIVMLAGGPGGAGSFEITGKIAAGLNADREVIFVDQRGTHFADPLLSCPEAEQADNDSISIPFLSSEATAATVAANEACIRRIRDEGFDPAAYNTAENAADFADLRVALGIDEWNVYGVSYGSRLALSYLRDHPEGIRSVVLDSVSPPNVNIAEDWWSAPASSFRAIFAACAAQPSCAAAYPDLEADFFATVNRLVAAPEVVQATDAAGQPITVNIDAFPFLYAIIMASERGDASGVPKMIDDMAKGDTASTVEALLALQTPDFFLGLGGWGLAMTVFCGESANITTEAAYRARSKELLPEFPDAVFAVQPKQARLFQQCPVWDVPDRPDLSEPAVSDLNVLIMEGMFDAATAPVWIEEVTPHLSNVQVVEFPFTGHDVLGKSQCAKDVMSAFLDDPSAPVDGSCAAETELVFTTG